MTEHILSSHNFATQEHVRPSSTKENYVYVYEKLNKTPSKKKFTTLINPWPTGGEFISVPYPRVNFEISGNHIR